MTEKIPSIRKILFYLALVIEIALVIVDKSELHNPYVSYFFRVTFLLTLAVVLLSDYTKREWIVIAMTVAVAAVSYRISGRNEMLRFAVFVFACKHMKMDQSLRLSFLATTAGCIAIVLLSVTGILGRISLTQDYGRSAGVITRYTFGFGHPNAMQCMFIMLMLLGMYLYERKMKWYIYLLLMLANYGIYKLTDSRTGFLVAVGAILLAVLLHYTKLGMHMWTYICGIAVMGGSIAFSVWAAVESIYAWCDGTLVFKLNGVLNGRIVQLYWGTNAHEGAIQTWRLFSSRTSQEYFDMGWVRLFYWYGWIPAILVIVLLVLLLLECGRRHDSAALMLIVSMSVYTIVEAHLVSEYIGRNYLLLILGAYGFSMLHADQGRETGLVQLLKKKKQNC
ncbi:MAG: hypothetical protein LKF52_01960 [Butyrivibrio sp.]|jgi:hypothetical protein|nr:hypothetical protein [Butyrivibrio sp.]